MKEEMTNKEEIIFVKNSGSIEQFCKNKWQFQQTFRTPLQDLKTFVRAILSVHAGLQNGCVTIDQVVFQPKHLVAMFTEHVDSIQFGRDWSMLAIGPNKVEQLLEAALGDWIDFSFVPTPDPFTMYADHDEYVTFFAHTKSSLDLIVEALSAKGFTKISGYVRNLGRGEIKERKGDKSNY